MTTPFGRSWWARLPFQLNVSSEILQQKLNDSLKGLGGIFTIVNDIIIVGCGDADKSVQTDNDENLKKLHKCCEERHIVLNKMKKDIGLEITFHGHKFTAQGIKPDDSKIKEVLEMTTPRYVTKVKRICGLVQYMASFLPDLSKTPERLRNLTRKKVYWD